MHSNAAFSLGVFSDMKYTDKAVNNAPMLAVDSQRNISVDWKKHAQPWITYMTQNLSHGPYISHELDRIGGGQNVAVVIGIGQHLRAFPLELFINRLLSIRRAIQRLVARSPQTTVFIKLENTRELTSVMVCFSDWHGHLQNLAQREVFGDLRVGIVDAWDMAVAANTFVIHPSSAIIAHQVDVLLSHLCPAQ
ncbi:NXPE family member 1-like [Amia ocellicauda]|uniref:NXPE family member 1-like n=1 Tax=Amia ocellicauda TaxID=2972642 RepID=UPI0034644185